MDCSFAWSAVFILRSANPVYDKYKNNSQNNSQEKNSNQFLLIKYEHVNLMKKTTGVIGILYKQHKMWCINLLIWIFKINTAQENINMEQNGYQIVINKFIKYDDIWWHMKMHSTNEVSIFWNTGQAVI